MDFEGEKEEVARGGFKIFHDFELNRWIGDWEIRPSMVAGS